MTRVAHLRSVDLDQLAIDIHRETDPDFDIPEFSRDFGAYAPDPDRDYERGRDAGFQEGYQAAVNETRIVRWYDPWRPSALDWAIACAAAVLISVLLWAGARP